MTLCPRKNKILRSIDATTTRSCSRTMFLLRGLCSRTEGARQDPHAFGGTVLERGLDEDALGSQADNDDMHGPGARPPVPASRRVEPRQAAPGVDVGGVHDSALAPEAHRAQASGKWSAKDFPRGAEKPGPTARTPRESTPAPR